MTAAKSYLFFLAYFIFFGENLKGQTSFAAAGTTSGQDCKPAFTRQLFHDWVNEQQQNILKLDGRADNQFNPSVNEDINFLLTQYATAKIDALQCSLETDSTLGDQGKKKYLKGIRNLLSFYITSVKSRRVSSLILPDIIIAHEKCIAYDRKGLPIDGIVKALSYDAAYVVSKSDNETFVKNPGYKACQDLVILKYCILHPAKIFSTLSENPGSPFADSLIRLIATKYPKQLYDYSQANNKLGQTIRNITDDKFIATVVKMSRTKDGQQYFCFLDNILHDKMTMEEVDAAKNDSVLYYRLLVKTQIEYAKRAQDKDTAFEFKTLSKRLEQKAKENFVNIINGLHVERNMDVRFKSIQSLTPEELYYLAVTSDGSMYTSSFVKGVYPLMMKKLNNRGDSLLIRVNFDRYRKFIKMTAGFNMLDQYLASFPKPTNPGDEDLANVLMRAFVNNLEKSDGIEDGVDVADSYASIAETLKPVGEEMLRNIQANYQRNVEQDNKKGIAIYNILNKLFLSADSTKHIDLTKELHIPPIYEVPYKDLTYDSTGKIAIQLFIYGDKDGIGLFPGLVGMFNNSNWKIDQRNKQWVTITAAKGKPVTLYMNRPLPEEGNEDAKAQEALCKYLAQNNISVKVTINRGHSYNAPYTIEQMSEASKIVFMGSCGGYRSIHDILEKAEDAHIIGTKQIADAEVNNPFLKLLSEKLRTGSNIEWIPFWKELSKIATDPIFEDYVPPQKNLGALFIKAYKIAMEQVEE